jgi:hypothetical protein
MSGNRCQRWAIDSASADVLLMRVAYEHHVAAFTAGPLDRPHCGSWSALPPTSGSRREPIVRHGIRERIQNADKIAAEG